eukprot:SAG31_NODE_551_length_14207_cov_7.887440_2_plen_201_part_00
MQSVTYIARDDHQSHTSTVTTGPHGTLVTKFRYRGTAAVGTQTFPSELGIHWNSAARRAPRPRGRTAARRADHRDSSNTARTLNSRGPKVGARRRGGNDSLIVSHDERRLELFELKDDAEQHHGCISIVTWYKSDGLPRRGAVYGLHHARPGALCRVAQEEDVSRSIARPHHRHPGRRSRTHSTRLTMRGPHLAAGAGRA